MLKPTDDFPYVPLPAEVATGVLEPRRVSAPLATALPDVRVLLGEARTTGCSSRWAA
ncbi:hypothetical protein [Streptomyces sp. NBC_01233]|uniref:hypothetical protein n=1 Tax=Streptomyces sp. NBC_01233 TaxID=2903787 RepID=UPI002E15CC19|nr:hypothetical protein OG332_05675 [Streptomyces sp. NBC_01233]